MKFKQIVYRGNGALAALDTVGGMWETQTQFASRRSEWHRIPSHPEMKAPVLSLTAQGDRLLAIDGDRQLWQQNSKIGLNTGERYEWRRLDMPVIDIEEAK